MVVKSVVVATLVTGSCRAVVVTVVTVGVVTTTMTTAALGTKPDREVVTIEPDTGAIVVAVLVTVVEEDIESFVTLKLSLSF